MDKQTLKEDIETIQQIVRVGEMQSGAPSFIIIIARVVQALAEELKEIKILLKERK